MWLPEEAGRLDGRDRYTQGDSLRRWAAERSCGRGEGGVRGLKVFVCPPKTEDSSGWRSPRVPGGDRGSSVFRCQRRQ